MARRKIAAVIPPCPHYGAAPRSSGARFCGDRSVRRIGKPRIHWEGQVNDYENQM